MGTFGGESSSRRRGAFGALVAAVFALVLLAPAAAGAAGVADASAWLVAQQNADGGYGASAAQASAVDVTCWAMLGLAAAGLNPADVTKKDHSTIDFLRGRLGEVTGAADLARTILALQASGVDPRKFGGQNLVARLLARRGSTGAYEGRPSSTALAVIALREAGGGGGIEESLGWLRSVQNEDGGWGEGPGAVSTSEGTGAVLQALAPGSKASSRGLSHLRNSQLKGGGYPAGANGPVNTQSTSWAVQGIVAAGGNPGEFRRGGASATGYLESHQEDDGHYRYSGSSDQAPVRVTAQAVAAVAGTPFPIAAPARKPKPATPPAPTTPTSGGVPPAPVAPAPALEAPVVPPSGSEGGGAALPSGGSAAPQPTAPVEEPPAAEEEGDGSGAPASSPPPAEAVSPDSEGADGGGGDSGVGDVAIPLGLGAGAGALLFGAAWAGRRGWMRWRYGI